MRFPSFRIALAALSAASLGGVIFACGSAEAPGTTSGGVSDGGISRDSAPVDVFEGGIIPGTDSGTPPPPLSCAKYCDLVQAHCKNGNAQYDSVDDCLAFCEHVPPGDPYEAEKTAGLYCRQYYAGNPSLTDPEKHCAAAGPFGGGVCGDRCTAFCQVAVSACSPDGGGSAANAPYQSVPKCKTECIEYAFKEAGADGGGEGLDGPSSGDTLNCRLYHLRKAVADAGECEDLGPDAGACR